MSNPKNIASIPLFLFIFTIILGGAAQSSDLSIITSVAKKRPGQSSGSRDFLFVITPDPDRKIKTGNQSFHLSPSYNDLPSLTRSISAKAAIVMDGISGKVLYAYNPDLQRQPASTIKVLTALISMENLGDEDWVYVSNRASRMPRSKIYLSKGKSYYAKDLIEGLLISSANDAGVALSEKIAGSEYNFAGMMTEKARELGAYKTVCKSATGLTRAGQRTTARDLAVIFDKAMEYPEFVEIMRQKKSYTSYGKLLRNHNKALWRIEGAMAGKTGYTNAARQTYVGQFKRDNKELIVAILGSESMWHDIKKIVDTGFRLWNDELTPAPAPSIIVAKKKQRPAGVEENSTEKAVAKLTTKLRSEASSVITGNKKYPYM